jgi:pimeloyl-ACP methyl ester carboxylesterase
VRHRLSLIIVSAIVLASALVWSHGASEPIAIASVQKAHTSAASGRFVASEPLSDYTFVAPGGAAKQPVRLLVALHGMGGNGADMATMVKPLALQQGWAILAPNMPYHDYLNPDLVRRDGELLPRLKALIDALPARTGLSFQPQVLIFGFSRGSQEAIRYSLMFPEFTLGVAGLSAGSYTLPSTTFTTSATGQQPLPYPYGTADVDTICGRAFDAAATQKVAYFIGVGGADTNPNDVPRQWDQYLGTTRLERAQRYVGILQQFGAHANLEVFPGASHEVTDAMRDDAVQFLATVSAPAAS